MHNQTPLIFTIVAGLVMAFVFGALAQRLRISPLVGYLVAGIAVGPFTPGFVADQPLAAELAEIGVILLMFGVGLHFSLKDLLSVRLIAVPGALVQITVATLLGMALGWFLGWPLVGGFVFGLALSVASTVVLLRALQERRLMDTDRGRIAVGWLIVEDLAMVLALVLIPAIAESLNISPIPAGAVSPIAEQLAQGAGGDAAAEAAKHHSSLYVILAITLGKVIAFIAFMLIVGRRVIPKILHWVAHTGSRELFNLSVLAIALGVALGAALLFDVSFALGAFFAGMILNESPLSSRAAEESLPLRDAFAVLFFVSVGMLFDPGIVLREPLLLIATLGIILIGKSIAAYLIVRAFGRANITALTISASLGQIGEFSFILAGMGMALGLLPQLGHDLILAGAILSIMLNPVCFIIIDRLTTRAEAEAADRSDDAKAQAKAAEAKIDLQPTLLKDHAVLVGYGRVGGFIGARLKAEGVAFLVIEDRDKPAGAARAAGAEIITGNAADPRVLKAANLAGARSLMVAIPQSFEAGQVVSQARAANPDLKIIARAHSDAEVEHLQKCGATATVMGEHEVARGMLTLAHS